jgi:hypothetical protein
VTIDSLLDAMLKELDRDAGLPDGHPQKRNLEQRDELWARITRLQMSKYRSRVMSQANSTIKNGVSQNGKRMGRPPQNVHVDPEARKFLQKVSEVTKHERTEGKESPEVPEHETSHEGGSRDEQGA